MESLTSLTACDAAQRIAAGALTSERLVAACLDRIDARDAEVGAWANVDRDAALAAARALDGSPSRGPLHGVPVGVKDIIDTADQPTGYGSALYRGHRPAWDAACVAALRAAGAVIIGKTTTSEFAAYHPARTRNPRDLTRTTGISSMGAAAAVADDQVPLALGTQTGASIIRPAAFCGVVGYKPSFGSFSRAGIRPMADSLDTLGGLARSVGDLQLLGRVLSGDPDFATARLDRPVRLGLFRTPGLERAEPAIAEQLGAAAAVARLAGFTVAEAAVPAAFAGLDDAVVAVMCYEAVRAWAFEDRTRRDRLGAGTVRFLDRAAQVTPQQYRAGRAKIVECRAALTGLFEKFDALLAPSAECEAGPADDPAGNSLLNRLWTGLHVPCLTLPLFTGPKGLPIGLQLVGAQDDDARLLEIGRLIHEAEPTRRGS